MNLDLQNAIKERIIELEDRIVSLKKIQDKVHFEDGVQFAISEIWTSLETNSKKRGLKVGHDKLAFLEDISGAVVYIFEMSNITNADKNVLIERFQEFRSIGNKDEDGNDLRRASSKIVTSTNEHNGNILYVGSVRKGIATRVRQHLGFGHKRTYALQLKHWMPPNTVLKFHYMRIPDEYITYEIEAAMMAQLKPLLGKQEK